MFESEIAFENQIVSSHPVVLMDQSEFERKSFTGIQFCSMIWTVSRKYCDTSLAQALRNQFRMPKGWIAGLFITNSCFRFRKQPPVRFRSLLLLHKLLNIHACPKNECGSNYSTDCQSFWFKLLFVISVHLHILMLNAWKTQESLHFPRSSSFIKFPVGTELISFRQQCEKLPLYWKIRFNEKAFHFQRIKVLPKYAILMEHRLQPRLWCQFILHNWINMYKSSVERICSYSNFINMSWAVAPNKASTKIAKPHCFDGVKGSRCQWHKSPKLCEALN